MLKITNKRKFIISIIFIIIILLLLIIIIKKFNKTDNETNNEQSQGIISNSEKIQEIKKIGNLELSDMHIEAQNSETTFVAKVTNTSNKDEGEIDVKITLLDEQGNQITQLTGYIGTVKSNQSTFLRIKTTLNIIEIYDYKIDKI